MTTMSVLNLMPENKEGVKIFVNKTKETILNNSDILRSAKLLKCLEDVVKSLRQDKEINEAILNEAEKHGKTFDLNNCKYQIKETGVKYDYSVCEDSQLNNMYKKLEQLTKQIKEREEILKAHKTEWVEMDTGEVIYPPVKKSTTKVTITLNNGNTE